MYRNRKQDKTLTFSAAGLDQSVELLTVEREVTCAFPGTEPIAPIRKFEHDSEDFGLVFIVLKSLLGIARQWSRERFCSFVPKASEPCKNFNLSKVGYSPGPEITEPMKI